MKSIFSNILLAPKKGSTAVLLSWILSGQYLLAQNAPAPVATNNTDTFFWIVTISVIAILAVIIGVLVRVITVLVENERKGNDLKRFFSILLPIALLLGSTQSIFAQNATTPVPDFVYQNGYYILALLVISLEALTIILLANFVYKLLIAFKHIKAPKKSKSWFNWESLTAAVSVEREAEIMTDHDYDGIRELDNQLPPWWVYGFYGTILFAILYLVNYHVLGISPLQGKEYANEIEAADVAKRSMLKTDAVSVDESNVTLLTDADALTKGKGIFKANCAACHGQLGEGLVGPNFTDDYWIHGGGIVNVFKIGKYGVAAKGMAAWEKQMSPQDLQAVCSYIISLQGTNPPNAKAPQGDLYKPDAAAAPSKDAKANDTAKTGAAKDSTAVAK